MGVQTTAWFVPLSLLENPRFAFIAKTEEEWAEFRRANIVLARDTKTGKILVVFGREDVQRAKGKGDEGLPALVVSINPDSDELECLATACDVLKGRRELKDR